MGILKAVTGGSTKCAVVGLGYVGLPLAVEFGKVVKTVGFDVNESRVTELRASIDRNGETTGQELKESTLLEFSSDASILKQAKFIVIAVPTPITKNKQPDLSYLTSASTLVGENLSKGSIIVYESTVYPGVTEEVCVPVLEKSSGLKYLKDFKVGYSPERINPGDKVHNVRDIVKVVSGCDVQTLEDVAEMYSLVVTAGVYKAKNIKCAEAAKVIENTQRDLNIALMNELAIIFNKMGIDTVSVLEAAGTKWNFINMRPGLVGGHCIGVDPYYLTYKADEIGYHPQVILAGRKINDGMGKYIAETTIKKLIEAGKSVKGATVLVCGITFKENVSDIRNSRVIDIVSELKEYGVDVKVYDPLASKEEVNHEYGVELLEKMPDHVDGIVLAVSHDVFHKLLTKEVISNLFLKANSSGAASYEPGANLGVFIDVKGVYCQKTFSDGDVVYWRL